jgi:hypothetical protein
MIDQGVGAVVRQNLGAIGWNLSREQVAQLDAASTVTPPCPAVPISYAISSAPCEAAGMI